MGFIREVYGGNRASLIVAFNGTENTDNYYGGQDIEGAMAYLHLYMKDGLMYVKTDEELALDEMDVNQNEVALLREKINTILPTLTDETAVENTILFPTWKVGVAYAVDDRVRYNGFLYKVLQAHTSQAEWTPIAAASLFARILIEDPTIVPDWVQPLSTNPYTIGDKVKHNGRIYKSLIENNVWEPSASLPDLWKDITDDPYETNPEPVEDNTWVNGQLYNQGDVVTYDGNTYRSLYDNNGNLPTDSGWWELVTDDAIPEFVSGTTYQEGDEVIFEGATYRSTINNNVWSPADYPTGWTVVE